MNSTNLPQLINTKACAEMLHKHPESIRRMARQKRIPVAMVVGREYLFNVNTIKSWGQQNLERKREAQG